MSAQATPGAGAPATATATTNAAGTSAETYPTVHRSRIRVCTRAPCFTADGSSLLDTPARPPAR
ncbi:hypothetical protein [Mycolicibacterium thermoresistibile]|uniref:Uncharacterized protein n=1 Tax=Mycolicibacterium thermoresistibile (strain ATCC 19527 / DSM 44167 / CIP 105390 / JCM 6362 / NCTC 10409 / 316) TaxID=1078020 RepID=G7CIA0_MYCT3|nr:hypothetical protein [Mycolicibacterium thermoresistibile]EHI11310.1 hypothetical protein KEK_10463 [Mycolicibacterium thermoresistibile ATCC 19527]